MVALNTLLNTLILLLRFHNTMAFRQNQARIVTPTNQQSGGTSFGNPNFSALFPPNNNDNNTNNEALPPAPLDDTEGTKAVTSPSNGDSILEITFPTTINIFLNITSNNGFGVTTTTTTTNPPDISTDSTLYVSVDPSLENIDIDSSNGKNQHDLGLGTIDMGGNGGDVEQPPTQIVENKMVAEEKCEEYYNMTIRKTRTAKVQVFIVGGTDALPKEFPHMAALGYGNGTKKEWLCGGSLISENYVVTAAHCLSSKTLGDIQFVRLGTTNLKTEPLDLSDYRVSKKIPHPDYTKDEQYNDIALLRLDHAVKFSDSIAPICLYPIKEVAQKKLFATGWGRTESAGEVSAELRKVELEYFPNDECRSSYDVISKRDLPRGIVDETQVCAGSRKEVKDTCQGDSGGPLQFQDNGRMYLVGITSFGIGCGKPGSPGVYTRVSHFISWIEKIVWGK